MDNQPTTPEPGRYDLFFLTRAYNRGEISFDEWMQLTRQWADAVLGRSSQPSQPEAIRPRPAAAD